MNRDAVQTGLCKPKLRRLLRSLLNCIRKARGRGLPSKNFNPWSENVHEPCPYRLPNYNNLRASPRLHCRLQLAESLQAPCFRNHNSKAREANLCHKDSKVAPWIQPLMCKPPPKIFSRTSGLNIPKPFTIQRYGAFRLIMLLPILTSVGFFGILRKGAVVSCSCSVPFGL